MQGVSINIFVKIGNKKKTELGQLYNHDLYGKRDFKYKFLTENKLSSVNWSEVNYQEPSYLFQPQDYALLNTYNEGISVVELFKQYSSGVQTEFDEFSIQNDKISSNNLLDDLSNLGAEEIILKYNIDNKKKPKVEKAVQDVKNNNPKIRPILYRPFDIKSCIYTGFSNGIMGRPRGGIMRHFIQANYGLVVTKVNRGISVGYSFILNSISERHLLDTAGDSIGIFPLFLYPETKPLTSSGQATQQTIEQPAERKPNLNPEIVQEIAEKLGLTFTNEKDTTTGSVSEKRKAERSRSFAPIDVLDYIYAVLHSPTYREKYKEFLKIDFPRVPYPKDNNTFFGNW